MINALTYMQAIKNKKKGLNPYLDGLGGIYIP
jgi:hypothetical protein